MRLFCQKQGNFLTSRQKRVAEREAHVTLQETEALEHTIEKKTAKKKTAAETCSPESHDCYACNEFTLLCRTTL